MARTSTKDASEENGTRAVDRAVAVLRCFSSATGGLKVAEIEQTTGISRASLYRLLRTLEANRLVRRCSDPTRYELDYGIAEIAQTWLNGINFLSLADTPLQELADETDETIALCLYRDQKRVYVRELASNNPLTLIRGVGATEPLTTGAGGMAILAAEDDEAVHRILLPETPERRDQLWRGVQATRRDGYAYSEGTFVVGATAIAVAFFHRDGTVRGSISVSGPSGRLVPDRYPDVAAAARRCAAHLSILMG